MNLIRSFVISLFLLYLTFSVAATVVLLSVRTADYIISLLFAPQ